MKRRSAGRLCDEQGRHGMRKRAKQICTAFLVMCVICGLFWRLHWLTSPWEIAVMFGITASVILWDLAVTWIKGHFFKQK